MRVPDISRQHAIFNKMLGAVLLLFVVAPLTVDVPEVPARPRLIRWQLPECEFRKTAGHPCRSCGLTRSVVALYHGEWARSRAYNAGGSWVVGFLCLQLIVRWLVAVAKRTWASWLDIGQLLLMGPLVSLVLGH
jgi:hypothetical protein